MDERGLPNNLTVLHNVANIRTGPSWVPVNDDQFTQVIATLSRECREWPREAVEFEMQLLIEKKRAN